MGLWLKVSPISACLVSHYSPTCVFIVAATSPNIPAFGSSRDELITAHPAFLPSAESRLSFGSLLPHPCRQTSSLSSCLLHPSLLSAATRSWAWTRASCLGGAFHRRQDVREKFACKADRVPLLTAWSRAPVGLFAEWRVIEVNRKDLEVSARLGLLYTSLWPGLK